MQVGHAHGRIVLRFVDDQEIDLGRVLFEHRHELHFHPKAASVLCLCLDEEVPPHGGPTNAHPKLFLHMPGKHQGHDGLAAAGGAFNQDRMRLFFVMSMPVAGATAKQVNGASCDPLLIRPQFDGRRQTGGDVFRGSRRAGVAADTATIVIATQSPIATLSPGRLLHAAERGNGRHLRPLVTVSLAHRQSSVTGTRQCNVNSAPVQQNTSARQMRRKAFGNAMLRPR